MALLLRQPGGLEGLGLGPEVAHLSYAAVSDRVKRDGGHLDRDAAPDADSLPVFDRQNVVSSMSLIFS